MLRRHLGWLEDEVIEWGVLDFWDVGGFACCANAAMRAIDAECRERKPGLGGVAFRESHRAPCALGEAWRGVRLPLGLYASLAGMGMLKRR